MGLPLFVIVLTVCPLCASAAGCTFCNPPVNKLDHEVIDACSKEFFKAYGLAKCNLESHFLNTTTCAYERADLHELSIRLGAR